MPHLFRRSCQPGQLYLPRCWSARVSSVTTGGYSIDVRCIVKSAELLHSGGNGLLNLVFLGNIALKCQALRNTQCKRKVRE